MTLKKLNRLLHRDLGFIFFGMTIIYALSGFVLNHKSDWNPSFKISNEKYQAVLPDHSLKINKEEAIKILKSCIEGERYKKHYFPNSKTLKIFIKDGSLQVNLTTGAAVLEKIRRRPLFYEINTLHYNIGGWWTIFSDIFCLALILIAITGLFIIKGKKGIWGRGGIYTIIGMLIPILFLIFFYKP